MEKSSAVNGWVEKKVKEKFEFLKSLEKMVIDSIRTLREMKECLENNEILVNYQYTFKHALSDVIYQLDIVDTELYIILHELEELKKYRKE